MFILGLVVGFLVGNFYANKKVSNVAKKYRSTQDVINGWNK